MKFIEKTIELQKTQNWTKVNKLISNLNLPFNPQKSIGESCVFTNHSHLKLKVVCSVESSI